MGNNPREGLGAPRQQRPVGDNPKLGWKKLTSQEIAERRAKGLQTKTLFEELFVHGDHCKPKLFHIVLIEEAKDWRDVDLDDDELQAIKG